MEVKLGRRLKHLHGAVTRKLNKVNIHYLIWIVIHFVYQYCRILYQYFVEHIWNHVVVKYFVAIIYNSYYNSRIYYNFYHYYYHYYASSKKDDQRTPCQSKEDGLISRKSLVNLEDYLEQQDILNVLDTSGKLAKCPRHIAFSILNFNEDLRNATFKSNDNNNKQLQYKNAEAETAGRSTEKEVRAICKLICWSWMAQARVVSLYDYDGILERIPLQIKSRLQDEIEKTMQILKRCQPKLQTYYDCLPKIEVHDFEQETGSPRVADISTTENTLHICVFSRRHGKTTILETVNRLSRRPSLPTNTSRRRSSFSAALPDDSVPECYDPHGHHHRSELKESKVNAILSRNLFTNVAGSKTLSSTNTGAITEPDLLLIVGNLKSTMGFLPWSLRLTEIHWIAIPDLLRLDSQDFISVLQKYSKSQQRFGT